MERGILKGEARLLGRLLVRRFGQLPPWVEQQLNAATEEQLARWSEAVLDARTLSEVMTEPPASHRFLPVRAASAARSASTNSDQVWSLFLRECQR